MLMNYLSSESFWGSAIFMLGVWFGVFRAHAIFQFSRWLLIFITMSTMGLPLLIMLSARFTSLQVFSSYQAHYAVLIGFAASAVLAEFIMMFNSSGSARARSQSPSIQTKVRPAPSATASRQEVSLPDHSSAHVRLNKHEPRPMMEVNPEPNYVRPAAPARKREEIPIAPPPVQAKPITVNVSSATPTRKREEIPIAPPPVQSKPITVNVSSATPVRKREEIPIAPPPVQSKPEKVRKQARVAASTDDTQNEPSDTSLHFGNWRLFLYFFTFLLIVLFPPYHETITNSRAWLFITSASSRPFVSFDLTFLLYEAAILVAIFSAYEFYRSQN